MTEKVRAGATDDDPEDVRRAVVNMKPVTPELEGARVVETKRLGHVALFVLWEPDPNPEDAGGTLDYWPEERKRIHRSGRCSYWTCLVLATCGHLEAQAEMGLIQIADVGGDDEEEIEREVAEDAIRCLLSESV